MTPPIVQVTFHPIRYDDKRWQMIGWYEHTPFDPPGQAYGKTAPKPATWLIV